MPAFEILAEVRSPESETPARNNAFEFMMEPVLLLRME